MTKTIEIIEKLERRRRWPDEEKRRMVLETLAPGGSVSEVAKRHKIAPSQLFCWRRQALRGALDPTPSFLPVQMLPAVANTTPVVTAALSQTERETQVEIVLGNGRVLRVAEEIATENLARLIAALDPG